MLLVFCLTMASEKVPDQKDSVAEEEEKEPECPICAFIEAGACKQTHRVRAPYGHDDRSSMSERPHLLEAEGSLILHAAYSSMLDSCCVRKVTSCKYTPCTCGHPACALHDSACGHRTGSNAGRRHRAKGKTMLTHVRTK